MEKALYDNYVNILKHELIPALGCTEPIAIAYASAKARQVLGEMPDRIEMNLSGNIIKNVKGVTVPNSGGLRGMEVAAVLGVVGGNADAALEVLESVKPEDIEETKKLVAAGICTCELAEGVANLYVEAKVYKGEHSAEVTILDHHTNIVKIVKDGKVELERKSEDENTDAGMDKSKLTLKDIIDFANEVKIEDVKEVLGRQLQMNRTIAQEGLDNTWGAQVGKTLLASRGNDVITRACARAAAGSDARMAGCSLPVVINSGSGNQGITVSMPVLTYAEEWNISEDKLYRALCVSNLVSVHIKYYIGSLSAFCGAVSAGCGSGAAIAYMYGASYDQIGQTIINTLGNVGGIVCDGAKSSCAAKIASSVNAAILGFQMAIEGKGFQNGEGIVLEDVEQTIKSMGHVGRVGMAGTDIDILNIMIGKIDVNA
ncbi:MAG TPA: serine dehydratase subunit alpha family protein [Candidatus Avilachnospira avistercoris]|nr:serine dehydratase subunit alpha family protein [Candidatus Avilachnospira avistercoris]